MYILSDVMIWVSSFVIPILLINMLRSRQYLPFPKIIWRFMGFIAG
ncbi:hypothetical protein [Pedobacter lithocola]